MPEIMNPRADELLSVRQVATIIGSSPQSVYNLIADKSLPAIQLGPRRTRIRRSDLDDYLSGRTAPVARRGKLLDAETIAFLSELADAAPTLTEEQKDTIRAAFRGQP